jgi:hypothetical protein
MDTSADAGAAAATPADSSVSDRAAATAPSKISKRIRFIRFSALLGVR